jgi:DNA polymerase elongation subunit (family B)
MLRIIDIATAPLPNVEDFLGTPKPRKGTKDAEKQAEQIAEKRQAWLETAACDVDLCRITAIGTQSGVTLCKTEDEEREALAGEAAIAAHQDFLGYCTFNGHAFDLVVLQRRAKYLGVKFPWINLDRWKSRHTDLMLELSDRDKQRYRSLDFYRKRLGIEGEKPLAGADEAKVFETGQWVELCRSVEHDVRVIQALGQWWGLRV